MSDQRHRPSDFRWIVFTLAIVSISAFLAQLVRKQPDMEAARRAKAGRMVRPSMAPASESGTAAVVRLTALRVGDWRSPTAAPKDVAAPPPGATKTKSGLAFKVLKKGGGDAKPSVDDSVTVNYSGWTTDGKLIDTSIDRGSPAEFPLTAVIKGWNEGLQLMVTGEKRRFWIPADLAYGDKHPKAAGMLVFDVELLEIK
jgi:hypothetical protein